MPDPKNPTPGLHYDRTPDDQAIARANDELAEHAARIQRGEAPPMFNMPDKDVRAMLTIAQVGALQNAVDALEAIMAKTQLCVHSPETMGRQTGREIAKLAHDALTKMREAGMITEDHNVGQEPVATEDLTDRPPTSSGATEPPPAETAPSSGSSSPADTSGQPESDATSSSSSEASSPPTQPPSSEEPSSTTT
jgi:hypothetical protein